MCEVLCVGALGNINVLIQEGLQLTASVVKSALRRELFRKKEMSEVGEMILHLFYGIPSPKSEMDDEDGLIFPLNMQCCVYTIEAFDQKNLPMQIEAHITGVKTRDNMLLTIPYFSIIKEVKDALRRTKRLDENSVLIEIFHGDKQLMDWEPYPLGRKITTSFELITREVKTTCRLLERFQDTKDLGKMFISTLETAKKGVEKIGSQVTGLLLWPLRKIRDKIQHRESDETEDASSELDIRGLIKSITMTSLSTIGDMKREFANMSKHKDGSDRHPDSVIVWYQIDLHRWIILSDDTYIGSYGKCVLWCSVVGDSLHLKKHPLIPGQPVEFVDLNVPIERPCNCDTLMECMDFQHGCVVEHWGCRVPAYINIFHLKTHGIAKIGCRELELDIYPNREVTLHIPIIKSTAQQLDDVQIVTKVVEHGTTLAAVLRQLKGEINDETLNSIMLAGPCHLGQSLWNYGGQTLGVAHKTEVTCRVSDQFGNVKEFDMLASHTQETLILQLAELEKAEPCDVWILQTGYDQSVDTLKRPLGTFEEGNLEFEYRCMPACEKVDVVVMNRQGTNIVKAYSGEHMQYIERQLRVDGILTDDQCLFGDRGKYEYSRYYSYQYSSTLYCVCEREKIEVNYRYNGVDHQKEFFITARISDIIATIRHDHDSAENEWLVVKTEGGDVCDVNKCLFCYIYVNPEAHFDVLSEPKPEIRLRFADNICFRFCALPSMTTEQLLSDVHQKFGIGTIRLKYGTTVIVPSNQTLASIGEDFLRHDISVQTRVKKCNTYHFCSAKAVLIIEVRITGYPDTVSVEIRKDDTVKQLKDTLMRKLRLDSIELYSCDGSFDQLHQELDDACSLENDVVLSSDGFLLVMCQKRGESKLRNIYNDYVLERTSRYTLGHGTYGWVYKVYRKGETRSDETEWYAFKELQLKALDEIYFKREITALQVCQHPCIPRLIDYQPPTSGKCAIVMELIDGMSLRDFICKCEVDNTDRLIIAIGIAYGIEAMHAKGYIHRDLKSANVMITNDRHYPKIVDMGLARPLDSTMTPRMGTPLWMAPEIVKQEPYYQQADVYSYAIILAEFFMPQKTQGWHFVVYDNPDYPRRKYPSSINTFVTYISDGYRPLLPNTLSKDMMNLIKSCWADDYMQRPSFSKIIETIKMHKETLLPDVDIARFDEFCEYVETAE